MESVAIIEQDFTEGYSYNRKSIFDRDVEAATRVFYSCDVSKFILELTKRYVYDAYLFETITETNVFRMNAMVRDFYMNSIKRDLLIEIQLILNCLPLVKFLN